MTGAPADAPARGRLRRDLGALESYATLIGILIGAGIFKVTGQAWTLTGPSVILGYLVLAPAILATSVAYSVYLSTPLGREPGGEYTHISRTFGGFSVAFVGAWLKIISYVGALAYLSLALAEYLLDLSGAGPSLPGLRIPLALGSLAFFYAVHLLGVRWFGRIQVAMCVVLGLAIAVLVLPGIFAIRTANYHPFFTHGAAGFAAALPPLFFAYAGFESLAQAAGEVRDSTRRLPRIFVRGIAVATAVYFAMSAVAFGVLPGAHLAASSAPMADVGAVYLPVGAAWLVGLGAVMALTTSVNATMLVPSRLTVMLARDRLVPAWLGSILPATGTPAVALTLTFFAAALLLVSGQVSLALNIAVFALVALYFLHSFALLLLPGRNPALFASVTAPIPLAAQRIAAVLSMLSMGALLVVQIRSDLETLAHLSFAQRLARHALTTVELCATWAALGVLAYALGRRGRRRPGAASDPGVDFPEAAR